MKNYLDYESGAVLVMNPHIETDVVPTMGKAYGVEFFIKKLTGKLNGWISYTWSRTFLQMNDPTKGQLINNGDWYPANYDMPNDIAVVANYRINHRFSLSFNATYSTGRPITLPSAIYTYSGSVRTLYTDRNAYRIPDYFRTDFAMNIDGNHKVHQKIHTSWTIGVYNLTGRKNPYSVYYVSQNGVVKGYKLSIFGSAIPFLNFNMQVLMIMKKLFYSILILITAGCTQEYLPPVKPSGSSWLVVDGSLNSGAGLASLTLSRTTNLDTTAPQYERGAAIIIQGDDSSTYDLQESSPGTIHCPGSEFKQQ